MKATALILLMTMACGELMAQGQVNDSLDIHRTINLDSVVVTGRVPQVRNKGAISKVMVANTMLAKMGDAMTMLAFTPGLHDENGTIKVDGYGTPVYVLDGRILKNKDELSTLQADNIRSIEIDKMPSAEYSPTGQPVIKINTIKRVSDYLYLKVGNTMRQTRLFRDVPEFNMRGKFGKVSASLSYQGTLGGTEVKETYFRNVYHDDGSVYHVSQQRDTPLYDNKHQLNFALDYNIDKNNCLGLYYMYVFDRMKKEPMGKNTTGYDQDLTMHDIDFRTIEHQNLHNISLQYTHTKGKNSFSMTQDVMFNAKRSNEHMSEEGENYDSKYYSRSNTDYKSSSTNAKYDFYLPGSVKTTVGAVFEYIKSTGNSLSDAAFVMDGKYSNRVSMTEHDVMAYATFVKSFGSFKLMPSVIYLNTHRDVNSRTGNGDDAKATQHSSTIIPSVTLKYGIGADWNLAFIYNTYLLQPDFADINAGLTFNDSLAYSTGNTELRMSRVSTYKLNASWKDLVFTVGYYHEHAPIVSVMTPMEPGSNILMTQSINFSSYSRYIVGLGYSHTFNRMSVSSSANCYFPKGEYVFLDKTYKANKTIFTGQMNLNYKFGKHFYAFLTYRLQGRRTYLTMNQKPVNALAVGAMASLMNDRLNINLTFRDLLGKENYNNLRYAYGSVMYGTFGKNDMRGVTLRLSYTIFNKKVNVKTRNQNDGIIDRM